MARAAIYARFSSHSQREESIDDQVSVCRAEAARAGDEVVAVYPDSAKTGTNDDRPQFQRMLRDAERGRFEVLYIYKQDRFARNRYDAASNKMRLRRAGVRVVSAAERIPEGADGILLESLLEGLAEYYSANLRENVRRGMDGNAARCMTNGRAIYGYRTGPDGKYEPDPDEAPVARDVFERYAAGQTMQKIADALGARRTRRGAKFSPAYISKMLRREAYVGVYEYMGHRTPGGMPAIVDEGTWARVQDRLGRNPRHGRPKPDAYPLSGRLFLEGGEAFFGSSGTSATGRRYRYYRAPKAGVSVSAEQIEQSVGGGVIDALCRDGAGQRVADLVLSAYEEEARGSREEAEALRKRLEANEREQDNAVDAIVRMGASDRLARRMEELQREHESIMAELSAAESAMPKVTPDMVEFWIGRLVECADASALVSGFVSRVTISNDGRVFVEFNMLDNARRHDFGEKFVCSPMVSESDTELAKDAANPSPLPQVDAVSDDEFALFPMVEARRIELRSIAIP